MNLLSQRTCRLVPAVLLSLITSASVATTLRDSHTKALGPAQSSQKTPLVILADKDAGEERLLSDLNSEDHINRHANAIIMVHLKSQPANHKKLLERFVLVDPDDQAIMRGPLSFENPKPDWKIQFSVTFQYVFENFTRKQLQRAIVLCNDASVEVKPRLAAVRQLVKSDFREAYIDFEKMLAEPDLGDEMAIALMEALSEFGEHGPLTYIIPYPGGSVARSLDANAEQMMQGQKAWDDYCHARRRELIPGAATRSP